MSHRVVWIFVVVVFSLGLMALAMDADQLTTLLDSEPSIMEGELAKCCGPAAPPCRATGPQSPLTTSLHLRTQVR